MRTAQTKPRQRAPRGPVTSQIETSRRPQPACKARPSPKRAQDASQKVAYFRSTIKTDAFSKHVPAKIGQQIPGLVVGDGRFAELVKLGLNRSAVCRSVKADGMFLDNGPIAGGRRILDAETIFSPTSLENAGIDPLCAHAAIFPPIRQRLRRPRSLRSPSARSGRPWWT